MKTPSTQRQTTRLALVALAAFGAVSSVHAASVTWNVAGDGTWDTATTNWTGGSPDASKYVNGDTANFANTAGGNISLSGTIAPTATNVSAVSGTYTFSGTGITSGTLAKSGAGTLVLSGANTYSGTTTVSAGALALANANAVQNSAVTLNSGSTLQLRSDSATSFNSSGAVALQNTSSAPNVTIDVNNNGSGTGNKLTLANGISYNAPSITAGTYTTVINTTGGNGYTLAIPSVTFNNSNSYASGGNRDFILKFNPTSANVSVGDVTLTGAGTRVTVALTLDGTSTGNEVTGVIAMPAGRPLTKSGTGTWTLSGANTFTGTTTISAGTLALTNGLALQNSALVTTTGTSTYSGGAALTIGGLSGSRDLGSANVLSGYTGIVSTLTLNPQSGVSVTYSGNITNGTGAMTLTKTGTGTQILSGTNSYTGSTIISAGTLKFTKAVSLYNNGTAADWTAANIKVGNTAVLALNVGGTGEFTTGDVTTLLTNLGGANGTSTTGFAAGSSISIDTTNASPTTFTVADNMADSTGAGGGAIGLVKSGINTLELTGANSYSGATTINGGTLKVSSSGAINPTTGAALTVQGNGTFQYDSSETSKFGSLSVGTGAGNAGTFNQTNGTITVTGINTQTSLSGGNTAVLNLSGGTMTSSGIVTLSNRGGAVSGGGATTVNISGTATLNANGGLQIGSGTQAYSSGATINQTAGNVSVAGSGGLNLARKPTNASTATGIYNLDGGILSTNFITQDATSGTSVTNGTFNFNGGTLKPTGNSTTFMEGLTAAYVKDGGAKIDTGVYDITIGQSLLNFSGATTDFLTKSGSGTLTLSVANTYTGGTNINDGTLEIGNANALGTTGTIAFGGGTLKYGTGINTDLSSRFSTTALQAYKIHTNGNDVNLATELTSSGGTLYKDGAGKLTLSGTNNTMNGATTVAAGVLAVNGTLAATTVTVQNGGTLGGSGTLAGAVAVQNGGTLAPGNSIDSLDAASVSFASGATFAVEINSNAETNDLLTLTSGAYSPLAITNGALLTLTELDGSTTFELRDRLTLIDYAASGGGTWSGGLFNFGANQLTDGEIFSALGYSFAINYDDTSNAAFSPFGVGDVSNGGKYLTLTVVPEPTTTAFGLLALGGLLLRRRRD